jgi:hypothetical protein
VSEHVHRWLWTGHMDGCHSFTTTFACSCGAALMDYAERDVKGDPWSVIWMEPVFETVDRDERGRYAKPHEVEVVCFRCKELQAGAKPQHVRDFVLKDGTSWTIEVA